MDTGVRTLRRTATERSIASPVTQIDPAAALARHRLKELEQRLRSQTYEPTEAEIAQEVASLRAVPRAFRPPRPRALGTTSRQPMRFEPESPEFELLGPELLGPEQLGPAPMMVVRAARL
jgi:hypothetical protein